MSIRKGRRNPRPHQGMGTTGSATGSLGGIRLSDLHPALHKAAERAGYLDGEATALDVLEELYSYCLKLDQLHSLPVPYPELVSVLDAHRRGTTHNHLNQRGQREKVQSTIRCLAMVMSVDDLARMWDLPAEEVEAMLADGAPEALREIHDLHHEGCTVLEIKERLGIGRTTVYEGLRALGLKPNTKSEYLDGSTAAAIREQRRLHGTSIANLAKRFRVSEYVVKNALRSSKGKA